MKYYFYLFTSFNSWVYSLINSAKFSSRCLASCSDASKDFITLLKTLHSSSNSLSFLFNESFYYINYIYNKKKATETYTSAVSALSSALSKSTSIAKIFSLTF